MLQCILGKKWRSARYYAVRHFFSGWTSPRSMRNRWFSRHFENRDNTIVTVIDHVGWWTTAPIRTRTITKDDQIIKLFNLLHPAVPLFIPLCFYKFCDKPETHNGTRILSMAPQKLKPEPWADDVGNIISQ